MVIKNILRVWLHELHEIAKDEGILIFLVLLPIGYPILYALIYTTEVQRDLPVTVVCESPSARARELVRKVNATAEVEVAAKCADMAEAEELMRRRDVYGIIHLPRDFEKQLQRGEQVPVAVYSDLTSMLYYKNILLAVTNVAQDMNRDIKVLERQSNISRREEEVARMPIDFAEVHLHNPQGGFAAFLIPPVLMLILQQALCLGIGMTTGRYRERFRGSVVPLSRDYRRAVPITIGKVLCYSTLFYVMALYMSLCMTRWFGLPQMAHTTDLLVFFIPYMIACTCMGLVSGFLVYRREDCILLYVFLSIPLLFISGVSWPGVAVPSFWKFVGAFFPSTYGLNAYVRLQTMGATLGDIHKEMWAMTIQAACYFLIACLMYWQEMRRSVGRTILT